MNKSTKIRLNYLLGILISCLLLWGIGRQLYSQLQKTELNGWPETKSAIYLAIVVFLFIVNIGLEVKKWQLLVSPVEPVSYMNALKSVLSGIAFSLVTPNRIGEYPARILLLKSAKKLRLVSAAVLGGVAQMLAMFVFGLLGLIYYNVAFPGQVGLLLLLATIVGTIILALLYWRFEWWSKWVGNIKYLKKAVTYGKLLTQFPARTKFIILAISLLRFSIFTSQYLLMLLWLKIDIPVWEGFCMCALFFWAMAVIPTISFAEVGVRAQLGLFLFHQYSPDTIGILTATFGLWCINLLIPAVIGSILLSRARLLQ